MFYVGFIDILGFKNLVLSSEEEYIANIFVEIEKKVNESKRDFSFIDIYFKIMSDSIVVACDEKYKGAFAAVSLCCMNVQEYLLEKGILVRGGISYGDFWNNKEIMFGRGLVKAYELENDFAIYPRIIVDSFLLKRFKDEYYGTDIYEWSIALFEEDKEGIVYLDIAMAYMSEKTENELEMRMSVLGKLLTDNLMNTTLRKSVRDKYLWLKNEFNDFINRNNEHERYKINTSVF